MVRTRLWIGLACLIVLIYGMRIHGQSSGGPLALSEHTLGDTVAGAVADGSGGVWIVGSSTGTATAFTDAFQPDPKSGSDGYLAHIGADGSLLYDTYLGGSGSDAAMGIARDGEKVRQ